MLFVSVPSSQFICFTKPLTLVQYSFCFWMILECFCECFRETSCTVQWQLFGHTGTGEIILSVNLVKKQENIDKIEVRVERCV